LSPHAWQLKRERDFAKMGEARDATLAPPLLLLSSIQVNIRVGNFPPTEVNGVHCVKVAVETGVMGSMWPITRC